VLGLFDPASFFFKAWSLYRLVPKTPSSLVGRLFEKSLLNPPSPDLNPAPDIFILCQRGMKVVFFSGDESPPSPARRVTLDLCPYQATISRRARFLTFPTPPVKSFVRAISAGPLLSELSVSERDRPPLTDMLDPMPPLPRNSIVPLWFGFFVGVLLGRWGAGGVVFCLWWFFLGFCVAGLPSKPDPYCSPRKNLGCFPPLPVRVPIV